MWPCLPLPRAKYRPTAGPTSQNKLPRRSRPAPPRRTETPRLSLPEPKARTASAASQKGPQQRQQTNRCFALQQTGSARDRRSGGLGWRRRLLLFTSRGTNADNAEPGGRVEPAARRQAPARMTAAMVQRKLHSTRPHMWRQEPRERAARAGLRLSAGRERRRSRRISRLREWQTPRKAPRHQTLCRGLPLRPRSCSIVRAKVSVNRGGSTWGPRPAATESSPSQLRRGAPRRRSGCQSRLAKSFPRARSAPRGLRCARGLCRLDAHSSPRARSALAALGSPRFESPIGRSPLGAEGGDQGDECC